MHLRNCRHREERYPACLNSRILSRIILRAVLRALIHEWQRGAESIRAGCLSSSKKSKQIRARFPRVRPSIHPPIHPSLRPSHPPSNTTFSRGPSCSVLSNTGFVGAAAYIPYPPPSHWACALFCAPNVSAICTLALLFAPLSSLSSRRFSPQAPGITRLLLPRLSLFLSLFLCVNTCARAMGEKEHGWHMQNVATSIFYAGLFAGIYDATIGILLLCLPIYSVVSFSPVLPQSSPLQFVCTRERERERTYSISLSRPLYFCFFLPRHIYLTNFV